MGKILTLKGCCFMNFTDFLFFMADPIILTRDDGVASPIADAGEVVATGGGLFGGDQWTTLLIMYGALFIFGYFFMYRPHKKRQKAQRDMIASIKIGDSVMTTSGMYGKIVDITPEVYIVEFGVNKGVRVPIVKSAVSSVAEPNLSNTKTE